MNDKVSSLGRGAPPRWAALFIILGTTVIVLSGGGLILLRGTPEQAEEAITVTIQPTYQAPEVVPTDADQPLIDRQIVPPPTREASSTPLPTATSVPAASTQVSVASVSLSNTVPAATQAPAGVEPQGTPIVWTNEEKNALSWMCYYEVGGIGRARHDACLSVISTVRARYVFGSGMGTDVLSVLRWPNQFNIPIETASPHADFIGTVEQYQTGARGSCSGYFYFDSVPGGPVGCTIYGAANQFLEFHNGW